MFNISNILLMKDGIMIIKNNIVCFINFHFAKMFEFFSNSFFICFWTKIDENNIEKPQLDFYLGKCKYENIGIYLNIIIFLHLIIQYLRGSSNSYFMVSNCLYI